MKDKAMIESVSSLVPEAKMPANEIMARVQELLFPLIAIPPEFRDARIDDVLTGFIELKQAVYNGTSSADCMASALALKW